MLNKTPRSIVYSENWELIMNTIVYISGTRADFGLMRSTLVKIHQSSEFDLKFIITGMHLSVQHGYTITEIEKENFEILGKVESSPQDDSTAAMSISLANCMIGITKLLTETNVDLVLLQGDRGEQLAAAIAASHMNIPICHVSGGDVTGSIDDKIRNAISMFADIHCPATEFSANRLIGSLNIKQHQVHIVGEPGLDDLITFNFINRAELFEKLHLNEGLPLILIIQHPVTSEVADTADHMLAIIDAISNFTANKLIVYPNSDAGSQEIINVIEAHESLENLSSVRNLERDEFINVMKHCDVMIGNSSAGIVEAPSLQKPVINIGTRQDGRLQANNIINVNYDSKQITAAIKKALNDETFHKLIQNTKNPYGEGNSSELIFSILKRYMGNE